MSSLSLECLTFLYIKVPLFHNEKWVDLDKSHGKNSKLKNYMTLPLNDDNLSWVKKEFIERRLHTILCSVTDYRLGSIVTGGTPSPVRHVRLRWVPFRRSSSESPPCHGLLRRPFRRGTCTGPGKFHGTQQRVSPLPLPRQTLLYILASRPSSSTV